ncbi:MAG: ammonium transporter, partial [Saccharolobus sp.]
MKNNDVFKISLMSLIFSFLVIAIATHASSTTNSSSIQQLNESIQQILNRTSTYPHAAVPSWLDTGSNAWMLTAATLVGLQSVPGVA